jgi:hypothetical protein
MAETREKLSQRPQNPKNTAVNTAIERNLKYPSVVNLSLKSEKNRKIYTSVSFSVDFWLLLTGVN